jgi:hypothetical protein|nr:MAG TPA: hypothetical protein [Caudoviricetes sp.]DAV62269.1 MAG TPA: hypothetical protein [Caudoviricetes sp.]DAW14956.1 MAG TPA: hypothetical protein [Caudoviricetes sp.]
MDIVALVISICALLVALLNNRHDPVVPTTVRRAGLSWLEKYAGAEEQYLNKNKDTNKRSGIIEAADPVTINAQWRDETGQTEKDPLDFMKDVK